MSQFTFHMAEARYKNMWTFIIEANYGDAADIGSDMRCIICTRILINAHNSVCGCRYCLECVKEYLNAERRFCPGKKDYCKVEELDIDSNIYPDNAINNRISKLIVACRYSCGCRCELRHMEEHERKCHIEPADCPYVNVGCRETRLLSDKINKHLLLVNELIACFNRLESEIESMKKNTVELQSKMAEMRLAMEINDVRARETYELMDQIKQEVVNLRKENQLTIEENNSLKAKMEKYRTEYLEFVATSEPQLPEMCASEQTQGQKIDLLTEKYSCGGDKLGNREWQIQKEKEVLPRNIEEVLQKLTNELNDVKKRVREIGINTEIQNWGEFVWPIDGWAAKYQSAREGSCKEIFSNAFYSHKDGYKLCLSVCPYGHGTGKSTHLSVFFHLMQGPFDNILSWPFQGTVTLSLISQHTGIDHISYTITFNDNRNSVTYKKPSRERNRGLGEYKLIKLTEVSSNASLYWDDKIFIRCIVKQPSPLMGKLDIH